MIIQIFLILFLFVLVMGITYTLTNVWHMPPFLDYKPFNCWTCSSFWTLIAVYGCAWLVLGYSITAIGGWILAILNAIAMHVHEKKKTITVDNLDDLK